MPNAPSLPTVEDFLKLLASSGILPESDLETAREVASRCHPADSKSLARTLVEEGILTAWQARRLLAGITQFHIANYVLVDQLSASSLGRVLQARHQSLERKVAIRVFHRELTQDPKIRHELLEECRQAASLDHRNLVHIFDVGQERGHVYLVMEYTPARHLGQKVAEDGPMGFVTTIDILRQVAAAVGHLHDRGVVHGDLRPENVLCDDEQRIKVVGLGGRTLRDRVEDDADTRISSAESWETSDDAEVLGTLGAFAAPEQLQGDQPTTRSDVYSLGCLAYFLLTGRSPETDRSQRAPLAQIRPDTPRGLVRVVERMMARRPAERYRDATIVHEILTDLREEAQDSPPDPTPAVRRLHRRKKKEPSAAAAGDAGPLSNEPSASAGNGRKLLVAGMAALVLLAALAGVAWLVWGGGKSEDAAVATSTVGTAGGTAGGTVTPDADTSPSPSPEASSGEREPPTASGDPAEANGSTEEPSDPAEPDVTTTGETRAAGAVAAPKLDGEKDASTPENSDAAPDRPTPDGKQQDGSPGKPNPMPTSTQPDNHAKSPSRQPDADSPTQPQPTGPKPPPQKKKSPQEKKKPTKKPSPFAKLPPAVPLPEPGDSLEPTILGNVTLEPRAVVLALLLGGNQILKSGEKFELKGAQGGLAPRTWTVFHVKGTNRTPIATFDITDGQLRFRWEPAAESLRQARQLANTLLSLSSSGHIHKMALRHPQKAPPLTIDLNRSSSSRFRIAALPNPLTLFLEIDHLSEGLPEVVFDPGKSIPLARKSLRIRFGKKEEPSLFFLELSVRASRNNVSVTLKPYFQTDPNNASSAQPITAREVAGLVKQLEQTQQQLAARIQQFKKYQGDLKKARLPERKLREQSALAAQRLNLAQQQLQQIASQLAGLQKLSELQEAIGDKGRIYIRLYRKVGEDRIPILESSDDASE